MQYCRSLREKRSEPVSSSDDDKLRCHYCSKENFRFGPRFKCCKVFSYDMCESCSRDTAPYAKLDSSDWILLDVLSRENDGVRRTLLTRLRNDIEFSDIYVDRKLFCESPGGNLFIFKDHESIRAGAGSENNYVPNEEGSKKLAQDFQKLFQEQSGCDVTFKVKDRDIGAHKLVLMARSQTFLKMFLHDTSEAQSNTVVITDSEPGPFQSFLAYLYSAKVDNSLMKEQATALYSLADKYFVEDLKQLCLRWIRGNLDKNSFCDILFLAVAHSDLDLLQSTTEYFSKNIKSIIVSQKWKDFNRDNPDQANELLVAALNEHHCFNK